ncbi:DUF2075 domain-containing protein [Novacetimonas pomaceti]|uniref:DNA replication initiation protein n=1 Tax=Novacetimonas pomaceti TaxID=2021998 RepID=A0A318QC22_9PROT|nr:DUF2075 domain-containing protein [Novacetimonas pomaceti]MBV1833451.1 DUF2075 domain-containing protein [Novacetimonas pomaceti]PYD75081.1 DNA replication initiation protein [Novacetimonas pomaceti]
MQQTNSSELKLLPGRTLSTEQEELVHAILRFCRDHIHSEHAVLVIRGDAGTGKSLVINSAFEKIQEAARSSGSRDVLRGTHNVLLVNHPEMIKLYRNISESLPALRKKDYERPTTFVNSMDRQHKRADIVFIDEAHLLLSRRDSYNRFNHDNHLREIIRLSRIAIIVFDSRQVLKFKSYWDDQRLEHLLHDVPHEVFTLTTQFRVRANPDVMEWISAFCNRRILPLPARQEFDFRIYDDALEMYHDICAMNARFGLCRMLSTYDYPYVLNGQDHFIEEGRFRLRWDRARPEQRLPWAERADTIDEVGSVYTVQGFDLNYAGVILGPSVTYDPRTQRIVIKPDRYEDGAAFAGRGALDNPEAVQEQIILNSINVLMTRGTMGLYIYASNVDLRRKLHDMASRRA